MDNGASMHLAVSLFSGIADPSPETGLEFSRLPGFVQKAEAAGLDMVLLADAAPASDSEAANKPMPFEATTLLAALATVTSTIGLVAAASTIAHQPYNLARRFASLDIISHGRTGWNATMTQAEAANFSLPEGFSPDDFRRRSEEFIGIVQGLWRGWDADALLFDQSGGRFHDPEKMHPLEHKGEFFSVRGPLNVARSPQDTPVLVLSCLSEADLDIAARTADVILLDDGPMEGATARYDDIRRRVTACGRDPDAVKVLTNISFVTSGTAKPTLADSMEKGFRARNCDGFNILMPAQLSAFDDFVNLVLPALRRRGLVRESYRGTILRTHLGLAGGGGQ